LLAEQTSSTIISTDASWKGLLEPSGIFTRGAPLPDDVEAGEGVGAGGEGGTAVIVALVVLLPVLLSL
jgi:uncharacterized protein (UPF0261 family)